MKLVKIGVASTSVQVGDFSRNKSLLIEALKEARKARVHLLVTPELSLSGYSLGSLDSWKSVARQSWASLAELASHCDQITAVLGLPVFYRGKCHSAAAVVSNKIICGLILKNAPSLSATESGVLPSVNGVPAGNLQFELPWGTLIPTFDDCSPSLSLLASPGLDQGVIVCPMNAIPFTAGSIEKRRNRIQTGAAALNCICAQANLLGSDDGYLVFDGAGTIADPSGILAEAPLFSDKDWILTTAIADLGSREQDASLTPCKEKDPLFSLSSSGTVSCAQPVFKPASLSAYVKEQEAREKNRLSPTPREEYEEILDALALGLRDYYMKARVFKKILLALSGGQDSALCLLIALRALRMMGHKKSSPQSDGLIETLYLPNRSLSSAAGQKAAQALAKETGVPLRTVTIHEEVDVAFSKAVEIMENKKKVKPLTRQNLQARIRGAMMLNWSNNMDGLLLVTSNMSEIAVGYSTVGGDNQGGYSPLANVPKTLVTKLLAYLAEKEKISSLEKVLALTPSAELAPDQKDEDELMPYPVLDEILRMYIGQRLSLLLCWRILVRRFTNYDGETLRQWVLLFAKRLAASQWKRMQHPVFPRVLDYDLHGQNGFHLPLLYQIQTELDELENATQ
ncbi:MAG: NAD(+) synthase [Candidatus Hydrogenedens sp.]|jgi:NAD+ synthase (glutamine-hydrolysing)|nr:NAD(+) synthase [Candidatus Hydrogenedens sp.]